MRTIFDDITAGWPSMVIPLAVFFLGLIALFGLRKLALDLMTARIKKVDWLDVNILVPAVKAPSALFSVILSIYLGLQVSEVSPGWKHFIGGGLWTLFVIVLTLFSLRLTSSLALFSGRKLDLPQGTILLIRNVSRMVIFLVSGLVVLGLWGVPTSPLLLLIAVLIMGAVFAFRHTLPNLFARFQITAARDIKVGDYIKLENQKEGYVTDMGWSHTYLRSLDGGVVIIPNLQLIRQKMVNYGRPLKKATEPFFFKARPQFAELTGLKARNLKELSRILKESPEGVIYYHTHHFLGEQHRPVAHPSSDFALWVKDALENRALADRLSGINVNKYPDPRILRDRIVKTIEENLSQEPDGHQAKLGGEFQFVKSVNVILPTDFVAHDLHEFLEVLRKISLSSLYFHIVESRSRWGNTSNDFSLWLEKSLGEPELSREIAGIDPGAYSLEDLRSLLIQRIEKSIR